MKGQRGVCRRWSSALNGASFASEDCTDTRVRTFQSQAELWTGVLGSCLHLWILPWFFFLKKKKCEVLWLQFWSFVSLKKHRNIIRLCFPFNPRYRIRCCFRPSPAAVCSLCSRIWLVLFVVVLPSADSVCDCVTFGLLGTFQRVYKS